MTAPEVIRKMPEAFKPEVAQGADAVVQYDISQPMYHVITGGKMATFEGQATNPDVTISIGDDDLVKLMKGELNPMSAFMSGRLKLKGDMMLAQKLVGFIDQRKLKVGERLKRKERLRSRR